MRNKLYKILMAILWLALMSTFGCSSEDENGSNGSSYNYCITTNNVCLTGPFTTNTCNGQLSNNCPSSSSTSGSSSSGVIYGTPVTYEGETYETVVIGNQTWMARNLNYKGGTCYEHEPINCTTYGSLYAWETAMALSPSCNLNDKCTLRQIETKHQGICPFGWHIPSNDEWNMLLSTIGSSAYLNTYGFSAFGGGYYVAGRYFVESGHGGFRQGEFNAVGRSYWWSANESGSDFAYFVSNKGVWLSSKMKRDEHSVRCLKD